MNRSGLRAGEIRNGKCKSKNSVWFYSNGTEKSGPVPLEELVAEMTAGRVKDHDLLWREGMERWVPASEVLEVQKAVANARFAQSVSGEGAVAPAMAAPSPTNSMALTSMVLGICAFFPGALILTGLPAVICGHIARRQIRESRSPTGGDGMALVGLIMGYMSILFTAAFLGFIAFVFYMASQARVHP